MTISALGDLARVLALDECGTVLDSFARLPAAAPLDQALSQPPAEDALTAVAYFVRRGFDSSLVGLVRNAISGDVVARGLFAWDVLNGSIVERGPYREGLQGDARAVAQILPEPGAAHVRVDARCGAPLPGGDSGPRIAALMRLLGGGQVDATDASPRALEQARNFARILHRSHLSTMVSFYLADLVFRHHHRPAVADLVEVLLDSSAEGVEALVLALGEVDPGVHLQTFGNSSSTWYESAAAMPAGAKWATGFLALLVRELEQLPHDVHAWRSAAMILGDGHGAAKAAAECRDRLRAQATLSASAS